MQMPMILSSSIRRFFRPSNGGYFPAVSPPRHRLSPSSRFLLYSMASAIGRQHETRMMARNRPVASISRFCGGSNISSSRWVKGEELGEYSTEGMGNEYNEHTIKEFIAHPANESGATWKTMIATYGDECGSKTTMEVRNRATMEFTNSEHAKLGTMEDVIALCGDGHPGNYENGMRAETEFDNEDYMNGVTETSDSDEEHENWNDEKGVIPVRILDNSTHRDGSIYKDIFGWKKDYCIADRNETRLEPMMFSYLRYCASILVGSYLQFFSIKLAKLRMDCGSVELYGYIATRDTQDPLLNYIVNISRDNPIIVEQGSLIEMTGPKRGINFMGNVLLEYDMRIKIGDRITDDLQLIDGVTCFNGTTPIARIVLTYRIIGDYGAVDFKRSLLDRAFEATVDVLISDVYTSFNLSLSSLFNGLHEIQLFQGAVGESCDLRRRFVIAVMVNTQMHLKFKVGVGRDTAEHSCSFEANTHGCASHKINIEFASISVTVNWSTQPF